ncbi:hypothetical protein [Sorangium sp. So ce1099]|uniref:hypothetical protein n=1 Tax=Sorangium sp. So ce1099 TaxID=3133331 RepID=UPI003F62425D
MLASAFALGGCVASAEEADAAALGDEADIEEADIGSTQQAVSSGWTGYTSDEYAPIHCDSGSLMSAVQCKGDYCDDIRAYCKPTRGTLGHTYATDYFSNEGTNERICSSGYWVTGMTCRGAYCDDISLQCSYISAFSRRNCHWTGWMSNEGDGKLSFASGYYMAGAECSGDYCDKKRFYICQTT